MAWHLPFNPPNSSTPGGASMSALTTQNLRPNDDGGGWLTRERGLVLVLVAVTLVIGWLCYLFLHPFIPVLAWALPLASVARPLHHLIASRVRNADVAAGLAVVLVAILILTPMLFVAQTLVAEAAGGVALIQNKSADPQWLDKLESAPVIGV